MARAALTFASLLILSAAGIAGCSPKAKESGQEVATKAEDAAKTAGAEIKSEAVKAKDAVEAAAASHGMGVKATPDFVATAAVSDMFEIQSSQLALKMSHDPDIKRFAHHMITDHTKMSHDMKAAVAQAGLNITPPADLDADHKSKLDDLRGAGVDFDRKYLDDQHGGHDAAVGMFKAYADGGADPAVKAVAAGALPMIQSHLDEVKALQKSEDDKKSAASGKKM